MLDEKHSLSKKCHFFVLHPMPVDGKGFVFDRFPPFFDGLLPEGSLLEGLLKQRKIDKFDYLSQLIAVGNDLVGAITVQEKKE